MKLNLVCAQDVNSVWHKAGTIVKTPYDLLTLFPINLIGVQCSIQKNDRRMARINREKMRSKRSKIKVCKVAQNCGLKQLKVRRRILPGVFT